MSSASAEVAVANPLPTVAALGASSSPTEGPSVLTGTTQDDGVQTTTYLLPTAGVSRIAPPPSESPVGEVTPMAAVGPATTAPHAPGPSTDTTVVTSQAVPQLVETKSSSGVATTTLPTPIWPTPVLIVGSGGAGASASTHPVERDEEDGGKDDASGTDYDALEAESRTTQTALALAAQKEAIAQSAAQEAAAAATQATRLGMTIETPDMNVTDLMETWNQGRNQILTGMTEQMQAATLSMQAKMQELLASASSRLEAKAAATAAMAPKAPVDDVETDFKEEKGVLINPKTSAQFGFATKGPSSNITSLEHEPPADFFRVKIRCRFDMIYKAMHPWQLTRSYGDGTDGSILYDCRKPMLDPTTKEGVYSCNFSYDMLPGEHYKFTPLPEAVKPGVNPQASLILIRRRRPSPQTIIISSSVTEDNALAPDTTSSSPTSIIATPISGLAATQGRGITAPKIIGAITSATATPAPAPLTASPATASSGPAPSSTPSGPAPAPSAPVIAATFSPPRAGVVVAQTRTPIVGLTSTSALPQGVMHVAPPVAHVSTPAPGPAGPVNGVVTSATTRTRPIITQPSRQSVPGVPVIAPRQPTTAPPKAPVGQQRVGVAPSNIKGTPPIVVNGAVPSAITNGTVSRMSDSKYGGPAGTGAGVPRVVGNGTTSGSGAPVIATGRNPVGQPQPRIGSVPVVTKRPGPVPAATMNVLPNGVPYGTALPSSQ